MAGILIKNSKRFNIDLNAQHGQMGRTAFHNACMFGRVKTAEILVQKSTEFNINLNAKTDKGNGLAAIHFACMHNRSRLIGKSIF